MPGVQTTSNRTPPSLRLRARYPVIAVPAGRIAVVSINTIFANSQTYKDLAFLLTLTDAILNLSRLPVQSTVLRLLLVALASLQ